MSTKVCLECGTDISEKRRCASYCSRICYDAAYYQKHKAEFVAYNREYRRSRKGIAVAQNSHLRHKYGISLLEKERMFSVQGGKCANPGCRKPFLDLSDASVDHDHNSGRVRSLLCSPCNAAFGLLGENEDKIKGLLEYKENHTIQPISYTSP